MVMLPSFTPAALVFVTVAFTETVTPAQGSGGVAEPPLLQAYTTDIIRIIPERKRKVNGFVTSLVFYFNRIIENQGCLKKGLRGFMEKRAGRDNGRKKHPCTAKTDFTVTHTREGQTQIRLSGKTHCLTDPVLIAA